MPGVRKVLRSGSGVVVVADHFWQALKARRALNITWDPGANAQLDNAAIHAHAEKNRCGRTRPRGAHRWRCGGGTQVGEAQP